MKNMDILVVVKQKEVKQVSIFNKILNRIHNRIKITSRTKINDKYIWFNIPEYIFGEPVYEKAECIAYLVTKLEDNGFHVRYMHPNTLFVSWMHWVPSYVRNEIKKKTGNIVDQYGNLVKKGENDEDDNINSKILNDKSGGPAQKEQKQYTPIDQYKPVGNLVYKPEHFQKIEKKVTFS
jgi:hypothetical protein